MNYVWEHSQYTGTKKLIHIAIADVVNDMHNNEFFMTNDNLAEKASCTRTYANQVLKEMVEDGLLELVGKRGVVVSYKFLFKGVNSVNTNCSEIEQLTVNSGDGGVNSVNTEPKVTKDGNPKLTKDMSINPDVQEVWDAYIASLERFRPGKRKPKFSKPRQNLIAKCFKQGYSLEELKLAVTGWEHNDYNKGDNAQGKIYTGLETFLSSDKKIDLYIDYHVKAPRTNANRTISDKWGESQTKTTSDILTVDDTKDWDD